MPSIYRSLAGRQAIMELYDSIIARWPVKYDTFIAPTRYGETFIIASGKITYPPLVLLHGSASNAASWIDDIPEYCRYFQVYAVDLPGEPGKSTTNRFSLDSPAPEEWMEDWMNYLKIERTALLGISLGGWVALKFSVCRPERVNNLILLAPGGIVPGKRSFLLRALWGYFLRLINTEISSRFNYGDQPLPLDERLFRDTVADNFKPRFESLPIFTESEIHNLNMPIMLIAGAKDALFPSYKTAERLKTLVPQADIRILPEAGHILQHLTPLTIPFLVPGAESQGQPNAARLSWNREISKLLRI